MPIVTVFAGSFDGGDEIGDFEFPQVPQIGDEVSIRSTRRFKVGAVHYHAYEESRVIARVLLPDFEF